MDLSTRSLLFFYFLLGFCFQFTSVALRFWLIEDVQVTPAQMAAIFGIVAIPWCLKPLYGFISDSTPLFGFRRRPYMIISSFVSSICWIILPFCSNDAFVITAFLTISSGALCFSDVMADSLLVEAAREESDKEMGTIQSWSWIVRFAGGLSASLLGAQAYTSIGAVKVFLLNSMIPITIAIICCFIHDEKTDVVCSWRKTNKKLSQAIRQPMIYKPAIFIFVVCATPSYGTAMTYFYEKKLHFTPAEFGWLDVMGYLFSIIGTWIYKRWLRNVSFIKIFGIAIFLSFLLENTLLLLVFHINRDMGIPDFVFASIERIVITLVSQFILMPMVVLGARICPKGIEGTLYALLMSLSNMGGVFASEWGSLFTAMFGVTGSNFTNLWKLMLVCHACDLIPMFSLSLLKGVTPSSHSEREVEL